MKFIPEFDRAGVMLSIASLVILLYFGLSSPTFFREYWVAYAFWMTGFTTGFFFLARKGQSLTLQRLIPIGVFASLILLFFAVSNYAYGTLTGQQVVIAEKMKGFAIGITEELFFGVFLLIMLINFTISPFNNRVFAILITSSAHAWYHVPNWGTNPGLLLLFFVCFTFARSIFVFYYPKVGVILGAHGFWNLGVS